MRSLLVVAALAAATGSCVSGAPQPCTTCNGACVDTTTDSQNCGQCGQVCAGGTRCEAGACVASCTNAQLLCGSTCTDVQTDSMHCGTCSHVCSSGSVCSAGVCETSCASGFNICTSDAGVTSCIDTTNDSRNCAGCGLACGPAQACVMSACATQCGMGRIVCTPTGGGATFCTDTTTDNANCGGCNSPCASGLTCNGGHCDVACSGALSTCTNPSGTPAHYCANTSNDPANCGACGTACAAAEFCVNGSCANALAGSCDEYATLFPGSGDGDRVLYLNGKSYLPFQAYCADMDGGTTQLTVAAQLLFDDAGVRRKDDAGIYLWVDDSGVAVANPTDVPGPKTYLSLHLLSSPDANYNYAQGRLGPPYPPYVENDFTKVRFEPYSHLVHNDDFRFATVTGITQNQLATTVEYGYTAACSPAGIDGMASIDLRGTPFTVDPGNGWSTQGSFGPTGFSTTPSNNRQTMFVTGNGSCGEYDLNENPIGPHRLLLDGYGLGCAQIHTANPNLPSGVYSLLDWSLNDAGTAGPLVYCDMTSSGGGWTLVMKIDGAKTDSRFFYSDTLWTNEQLYNAGTPGLTREEAKYASYMATPFTQIHLLVTNALGIQNTVDITVPAQTSMLAAMSGPYVASTVIGVNTWDRLFASSGNLQPYCDREGLANATCLNCRAQVRIGVLGNDTMDCVAPDSYAGIGGEIVPPGECAQGKDAGFRGYSAGMYGAPGCTGGTADAPGVAYVFVR